MVITIKMNNKRPYYLSILMLFCFGFLLMPACEMQTELDVPDHAVSESLNVELEEALNMMSDDPEGAILKLDQVVEQANALSSPYYAGKAKWYRAYIYDEILEDVTKAYFGYNEALEELNQTEDAPLKVKVLNNLGILSQFYAHYDAAISSFSTALQFEDDIDDKLLSNVYYNLGVAYKLKGDEESFFNAEEAFTKSIEIAQRIEDHENIASVYNQIGMMYKDISNYDMARIAYRNTIKSYQTVDRETEAWESVGKAYHGIAVTYMEEKNYDEAIASFEKALQFKKTSSSIFVTKYDLGTVLRDAGYIEEAVATWKDALKEKHNNNDREQVQIYAKLTAVLAGSNNYEEAVKYAQIYNEHIEHILSAGEKYESRNNEVIFADIVREYAEFKRVVPVYKQPWAIGLMLVFIAFIVYAGSSLYYRYKMSNKVSDTMSELQVEFQNIKLD